MRSVIKRTSRGRSKSASYLRLKTIQGTMIVKFLNYHTAKKYPKGFSSPETRKQLFSELETSEKN